MILIKGFHYNNKIKKTNKGFKQRIKKKSNSIKKYILKQ